MGIRLTDMLNATAECVVEFAGEEIALCYYPNAVTLDLADRLNRDAEAADEKRGAGETVEYDTISASLAPVLQWWDVLDDEGNRLSPTTENMRRFPLNFLVACMDAITEDQKVDEGEDEGSAVG